MGIFSVFVVNISSLVVIVFYERDMMLSYLAQLANMAVCGTGLIQDVFRAYALELEAESQVLA